VQFVIVGNGPELENVKKLAVAFRLGEMVTFAGRVEDATLFTILSTADVCVNPDRPNAMNDKSTMNKIMEYMALGKPIVQFNLTEGRLSARDASLYAHNTDARDFGDKILELLGDPGQCARMGAFGQKRVQEVLTWEREAPKLLDAYMAALGAEQRHESKNTLAPSRPTLRATMRKLYLKPDRMPAQFGGVSVPKAPPVPTVDILAGQSDITRAES
jgi:glycosyltransferase involved in cell wall biosynthesis